MNKSFPLCYETFGDPTHPCIVLIMGIGGQLIDWPPLLIQGLADKGFYVVVFDNRDSGLSHHYDELGIPDLAEALALKQRGEPFKPPYTLEDMASDVVALMDELRIEKAHILGWSMGGIIAQYVALNFTDRVQSLTCLATTSGDPQLPPAKKEVTDFFALSFSEQPQGLEEMIAHKVKLFKIYNHLDYFDEEKIRQQITTSWNRAYDPMGFKRLILAMICAEPRTERLKHLKVPSLIIHGDCDPVFPLEHGQQLAACLPNSHLEIMDKMGHGLPDYFCPLIVDLIVMHCNQRGNTGKGDITG